MQGLIRLAATKDSFTLTFGLWTARRQPSNCAESPIGALISAFPCAYKSSGCPSTRPPLLTSNTPRWRTACLRPSNTRRYFSLLRCPESSTPLFGGAPLAVDTRRVVHMWPRARAILLAPRKRIHGPAGRGRRRRDRRSSAVGIGQSAKDRRLSRCGLAGRHRSSSSS